jgi:hypothetical protein
MGERIAYWIFGVALSSALTVAIGAPIVAQHGRRILPLLWAGALLFGLIFGWAIDGFIGYVRLSGQRL